MWRCRCRRCSALSRKRASASVIGAWVTKTMRDSHHDHLINLRDGKVIEFTSDEIEELQAIVSIS